MVPILSAVYDELVARAAAPPFDEKAAELRAAFDRRCGKLDPDHPSAGARDAAAWEDVLIRGGLAREIAWELADASERECALSMLSAQRGVFRFTKADGVLVARDLLGLGAFIVLDKDHIARELAPVAPGDAPICQGRLCAMEEGCAVLPGTVIHPADAGPAIEITLAAARDRGLSPDAALDALLLMEHKFRTYARVKVALAYRPDSLPTE